MTSDRRITTWASKQYVVNMEEISQLNWFDDPNEEMIVCLSQKHANIILGIVGFYLRWRVRWRANSTADVGTVDESDYLPIIDDLEERILNPMGCTTDLTRIADALEHMNEREDERYDSEYISILELKPLIQALPFGAEILAASDLLGEIFEAIALLPDVGINIRMKWFEWWGIMTAASRHRAILERLNDLVAACYGVAVGTQGPTLAGVIESYVDDLPGVALVDRLLGQIDESIVRAAGLDLPTLLSGNYVTNKVDFVGNTINGGVIPPVAYNVVAKLDQQTASIQAAAALLAAAGGGSGSVDGCDGCFEIGPEDGEAAEGVDLGSGDPPEGWEDWEEYSEEKCRVANAIVMDVLAVVNKAVLLTGAAAGLAIAAAVTLLIAAASGVGVIFLIGGALAVGAAAVGFWASLADLLVRDPTGLGNWKDELEATAEQAVCDLYNSDNPEAAGQVMVDWMSAAADVALDSTGQDGVAKMAEALRQNALFNRLFTLSPVLPESFVGVYDCTACTVDCSLVIGDGTGTVRFDGVPFVITSENVLGLQRIQINSFGSPAHEYPDCLGNWRIEILATTIDPVSGSLNRSIQCRGDGGTMYTDYFHQYSGDTPAYPPLGEYCIAHMLLIDSDPFTVTMRVIGWEGPCTGTPEVDGCE